ncbi:MAG: molybdenum cofactor guanylyltransferase [Gammaproteobacteria bacterium]|nr:molybdenum cofactor guanylyltransferase [Gammaproteobacteria bacterium]
MKHDSITAVILAGGRATRMGGEDKGLIQLNGRPMIEHVIAAITPQVGRVLINANNNQEDYARYGLEVVADSWPDYPGPLAGIASAMAVADSEYLLCVPCDMPNLPDDLVERLLNALLQNRAEASVVDTGDSLQPVCCLLRCDLRDDLHNNIGAGLRKVRAWLASRKLVKADFSDCPEAFVNINTPQQLASHG